MNNTQFVSFFVHRRKSRDRFRIVFILLCVEMDQVWQWLV